MVFDRGDRLNSVLKLRLRGERGERGERERILLLLVVVLEGEVGLVGGGVIGFGFVETNGWDVGVPVLVVVFMEVSSDVGVCVCVSSSGWIVLVLVLDLEERRGRVTLL